MKKDAMHQMGKWEVTNEPTQKYFNEQLIEDLDRMNNVDKKMKNLLDEAKIKQEILAERN